MNLLAQSRIISRAILVGCWYINKYNQRRLDGTTQAAARALRKQGVPVDVAVLMLAYKG